MKWLYFNAILLWFLVPAISHLLLQ